MGVNFEPDLTAYLEGTKFSSGYVFKVSDTPKHELYRDDYLRCAVEGKRILHIGCLDHVPLIGQKIQQNRWLHKILTDSAATCLGVDINRAGIEVSKAHGYENIVCHDLLSESPCPEIADQEWDVAILGDVLEHLDAPVVFLQAMRQKYAHCLPRLIVTVPNAFRFVNLVNGFKGVEFINSDHRYWFTPFTLLKTLTLAQMEIEKLCTCQHGYMGRRRILARFTARYFPLFRETLVAHARL